MTVVVPTYQGAAYLAACLESIAAQDLDGVEVLVVDDGSTDGTLEIARSFADRIDRLRVVENEQRLGAVGNVNRCIELARGRWIKPVFQDDLLEPGCLAAMRAARRRRVPVVVCARRYLYEGDVPDFRREACEHLIEHGLCRRFGGGYLEPVTVADVVAEQTGGRYPQVNLVGEPVAVMVERRALRRSGGFDTGYVQLWDYEAVLRLAVERGMVIVDDVLAVFRVHEGSETARNFSQSAFRINVLDRLRLHVAYATGWPYRTVRQAAAHREPPVDLVALAVGVAGAARVLVEGVPVTERPEAKERLDELASRLPGSFPVPSMAADLAADVEAGLIDELRSGPWLGLSETELLVAGEQGPSGAAEVPAVDELDQAVDAEPAVPESAPDQAIDAESIDPEPALAAARRSVLAKPLRVVTRGAQAIRANQWWGHMLGPIVAVAYLQLGWRQILPPDGVPRVLALLFSAVALAGYGYVVNDSADVEADRRVGKTNSMARFSPRARVAVVAVFALLGALPWFFVDLEPPAMVALAGIYLLPILYSTYPVRLKERPFLGPLADASNAFVVPALFTIALFAPLGEASGPEALMVVGAVAWAAGLGLRAILLHQVDDAG
ncbi:MAG: glycosyltransferase, partial [Acidimicrobiales bacterium]